MQRRFIIQKALLYFVLILTSGHCFSQETFSVHSNLQPGSSRIQYSSLDFTKIFNDTAAETKDLGEKIDLALVYRDVNRLVVVCNTLHHLEDKSGIVSDQISSISLFQKGLEWIVNREQDDLDSNEIIGMIKVADYTVSTDSYEYLTQILNFQRNPEVFETYYEDSVGIGEEYFDEGSEEYTDVVADQPEKARQAEEAKRKAAADQAEQARQSEEPLGQNPFGTGGNNEGNGGSGDGAGSGSNNSSLTDAFELEIVNTSTKVLYLYLDGVYLMKVYPNKVSVIPCKGGCRLVEVENSAGEKANKTFCFTTIRRFNWKITNY